jgi:glycosyltransferase involved in cell wall biosynthesis
MKILIFQDRNQLKNTGGPTGYLYNISEYLKQHPIDEISFLDMSRIHETPFSKLISFITNGLISALKKCHIIQVWPLIFSNFIWCKKFTKDTINYLNSFDAIHVHSIPSMHYSFKRNKVKGKLILTTHCPEPVTDEMTGSLCIETFMKSRPKLREWLLKKEIKAFDICDFVMFPVAQAREPYENASLIYKDKFSEINDKFFYVPTALGSIDKIDKNNHILDSYHIPNSALRLCYVGRHTQVKGYDFLQNVAIKVWEILPDTLFVIGGKEAPLKGLSDNRWLELGWINTAELLNEVDAFVLPNKNTYFDLILLEVLRQGTPVLISRTGGNKWFEDKHIDGIKFFEYGNAKELIDCIKVIRMLKDAGRLESLKESNRKYCQGEFNMGLYLKRYLTAISTITKK